MFKIHLGDDIETGKPVFITQEELTTHLQLAGVSGRGKSKELENIMLQLIENKKGFCLMDPHGTLYDTMVSWLETNHYFDKNYSGEPKRKIILFDPYEENYSLGFNPFMRTRQTISYLVDMMVLACASVWGGEDPNDTPRLGKYLTAIFHVLIEKGLTLYEATNLIASDDPKVRQYLTHDIKDQQIQSAWKSINALSKSRFDEEIGSTSNRLMRFLNSEIIRRIFGQNGNTIDFKKIMDEGAILLVNLKAIDRISFQNTCLLGTLIINNFYMACLGRDKETAEANPYYLIIDECPRYITEDIPTILDEGRKFGLHLMLSYQRLQQLRKKIGDDGFEGVLGGAQSRLVFGGLRMPDALTLTDDMFVATDQINMQEPKQGLKKPQIVGYKRTTFRSRSSGTMHTTTDGEGTTEASGTTTARGQTQTIGGDGLGLWGPGSTILTTANSNSVAGSSSTASSRSSAISDGFFESEGESEGLEPIMEELWTESYSLEEQKTKAASLLVRQPKQHAIIQIVEKKSVFVKVPFVPEPTANKNRVQKSKEQCYLSTQYIKAKEMVEEEIENRQALIKKEAEQYYLEHGRNKTTIKIKPAKPLEEEREKVRVSSPQEDEKQSFTANYETYDEQPIEPSKLAAFRAKSRKKTKA